MSENTAIEWAHHTFNPWSGCNKVSEGCRHCYAAASPAPRRRRAEWGISTPRVLASDTYWAQPLRWAVAAKEAGVRHRVFCASMADVFEARADLDPWRERLWTLIRATPELDWLLLTKRPQVMRRWAESHAWPPNAWAGASVESQEHAGRVGHLPLSARVRFVSLEPLLGPVIFSRAQLLLLDWLIVGGESGIDARPMHRAWAIALRERARIHRIAFFFKQWGEWAPGEVPGRPLRWAPDPTPEGGSEPMSRVGKSAAGRLLDGRTWDEFPPGHR